MFSRDKVKISTWSAKWACDNHKEKQFVFFLKLKRLFRNGKIENAFWRFSEFKQHFDFSEKTYRRRLNDCIELGWLIPHAKVHACIKNPHALLQCIDIDKLPKIEFGVERHYKFLKSDLSIELIRLLPIKICESSQLAIVRKTLRKDLHGGGKEATLYHKKNGSAIPYTVVPKEEITLSVRGIAKLINRKSAMTGHRLRVKCSLIGLINYENRYFVPKTIGFNTNKKLVTYARIGGQLFVKLSASLKVNLPVDPSKMLKIVKMKKENLLCVPMYDMDCFDW